MATLQGKAVKNTYRQVLQIGANNVGVSGTLQPVQDGAGVNTALSLSTAAATINGNLTITGDLIITGGGIEIKELIDDTVAALIRNGTGITWTYNDGAASLTGNFTGTTSVVTEGSNLYYTQGRFDSAFAAKSTTNLAEGTNLYFTEARGNANFATNFATKTTTNLPEGTNLYFTDARARLALSITAGTGIAYNNTTGVFNLAAIPNASLANSSITINGQAVSLGGTVTLTTTNIGEGTNLYWTEARGNSNFTTNLAASSTTNLAEGTNLYYTQARFDTAFSNKSTTNLAEGTNLYYTQARFNSALAAKSTTDLAEGTNLYYTDARARLALSSSATGLTYANNSGVFSLTAGYAIPTTVKLGQYDTAYNRSIVSAAVSGTTTKTLSLTQQDANVVSATWTDLGITTINGTANQIATTTVGNTTTVAFTNDVTMPNNLIVSGNLTINGTATYVNTQSISAKDPLFEVANDNNTTDAVDIGYYGRYYDTPQLRVEFTGLFRDASDAGKFKFFTGLVDEPTNVVNTTGVGYTVGTLVANFEGNLAGTANAANQLSTARTIAASGDGVWSVSFDGSANVTSALTLANTGVTATTYGTSTAVPTIAIDSKGRITNASNTNITFPVTTVNGQAGTVVLTTTNVAEGTNQYFTTARAQAAITGTAPISVASGVVSISQAGGATNGYLSSTDWNTFNNKLSTATAASTYVPYTGATGSVNLGAYDLTVQTLTIGKGTNALSNNTALGYQTLLSITTGNYNTAVGYQSGKATTTATYNTSLGQSSLFYNTTGGLNTAIGVNALLSTTTGTSNVALGLDSFQHNTSGSSNTALGYNAGSHLTNGSTPNTTASNGVFIGRDTKAKVDAGTNEIVIGYNAIGNGSNTVTIGNSSITNNYFSGNVTAGSIFQNTNHYFRSFDGTGTQKIAVIGSNSTANGGYLKIINDTAASGVRGIRLGLNGNAVIPGSGVDVLTILDDQSATFSSSVTAGAITSSVATGNGSFYINNASLTNKNWTLIPSTSGAETDLLFFYTGAGAGTRMTLTNTGNVGIGTSSPQDKLHVAGAIFTTSNTVLGSTTGAIFDYNDFQHAGRLLVYKSTGSNLLFYTNPNGGGLTEQMRITSVGNVGIGTISPSYRLSVQGPTLGTAISWTDAVSNTGYLSIRNSAAALGADNNLVFETAGTEKMRISTGGVVTITNLGSGSVTATSGVLSAVSDMNLKDEDGFIDNALEKVLKLKPRYYHWKEESGLPTDLRQLGFYAQEVNEALGEEAANTPKTENDKWGIYDRGMIAFLTAAIQEQQAQIEELKALIAAK
jgi:hypothetical protein